jgi:hypothetical protein
MPQYLVYHPTTIYTVVAARSAEEAIDKVAANKYDVFWEVSDTPNIDHDYLEAQEVELLEVRVPDDSFMCECCAGVFDVEESVKPYGKKGPMMCEACAEADEEEVA